MTEDEKNTFENTEEIFNWTYPGATLYYKDCDLHQHVIDQFSKDKIIRNGYFLDVSWKGGGIQLNTRFLIASSKAAKLYEINPDNVKYGHCCINANSYFKILDIYKIGDKTQIFLLHIPREGYNYFRQAISNLDENFIQRARQSFDEKIKMEPLPDLLDSFWLSRTNFPVGMDANNNFYPLNSVTPIPQEGKPLFNGIRNLTNDKSNINMPSPINDNNDASEKSTGFWNKLFGRN